MRSPPAATPSRLRFLFGPALLVLGALSVADAAGAASDNPLLAERWKTRPVVVVVSRPDDVLLQRVRSSLAQTASREAFTERDMVLFTVVAGEGRRDAKPLSPRQTQALLDALKLRADGPPTFVLVGKDGGVKMTEGPGVDLAAVFAEIDRMPMRQR